MIKWRELTPLEIKRILHKAHKPRVYDPVVYKGLSVAKDTHIRRFTLQKTITKTVNEEDANVLVRLGWEITGIYDPDDDE